MKVIKFLITSIITVVILALLAYGVSKSDFNNIKKQNVMKSDTRLNIKEKAAQELRYSTKVKMQNNGMVNLGDFTINISKDKKLIANISLKLKENNSWEIGNSAKKEISKKGVVLRDTVIKIMSQNHSVHVKNNTMKKEMIREMNKYLSDTEVEELYFNKFLVR